MATVKLTLDTRSTKKDGTHPVKLYVSHRGEDFFISTNISVKAEDWKGEEKEPTKSKGLNSILIQILVQTQALIYKLRTDGKLANLDMKTLRKILLNQTPEEIECAAPEDDRKTFSVFYSEFVNQIIHPGTKGIYQLTQARMGWFAEKMGISDDWGFEDITIDWLKKFEHFLRTKHLDECGKPIKGVKVVSTNTIAISMRNIRAVVNAAIDDELTTLYPFRKFKIKHEETAKRSLTIEDLRTLRDYPCEPHQEKYRDLFMLIFYLVGINTIDLFSLTEIRNGRIEYRRSKTGRLFSIKVEPEAQAIIDKYRGKGYLLNVLDDYANYKDFAHRMNDNLKQVGEVERKGLGGKKYREVLFPKLSTYWARHTWATIAAELDIPDETISLALGHSSGNRVTSIYINRNQRKVDAANRKVIDFLFGSTPEESENK